MAFKDQLAVDAHAVFLNLNEFAEEVTYLPYEAPPRTIRALIDRQRLEPAGEAQGNTLKTDVEISVANSGTYGIATVTKGQDVVYLPKVIGGTNSIFKVIDVLAYDNGMWRLLLRE